jgi:hypothetical protein
MLRCSIGLTCVLWAACSFGQLSPTPIAAGGTAEIVCKSESEEVVLHANASATLPVVDILPCDARVTVLAKQTGWYRVRTQGGKEGYVKDVFFATPVTAQAQDAAALEAQYKTCTKHFIPSDKCTSEIYQQLKAKDEAPLDPATATALLAVKDYRTKLLNPETIQIVKIYVHDVESGELCLEVNSQNQGGGMTLTEVMYKDGKWQREGMLDQYWPVECITERGDNVTEKVKQALKDER